MIKIIAVGKIKENYLKDAIKDYEKRINKYNKIEIIEIKDENTKQALKDEANNIKKHLKPNDYIITLEIEGTQMPSKSFASYIDKILITNPNITFIIGSSHGLDNSIKEISNYKLSFSKMTFPHQLFRVILLEQIYRAFKILNNETYHK